MNFITTNGGSYPRIGDSKELQVLRRTIDRWQKGAKTDKDLAKAQQKMTRFAVEEQIEAGIDLVTDGQIRWNDLVSHLVRGLEGVQVKGLLRLYDTNCYFRQPEIAGRVKAAKSALADEFAYAKKISGKPVKPVLTGPFTLASLSILRDVSHADAARDLAAVAALEVEALAAAGAGVIQIDEPEILRRPADLPLLAEALGIVAAKKGAAKLQLSLFWGDAAPLYDALQKLPVDILGLDFTYSPTLPDVIASAGSAKTLALGVIDGRNTRLESVTETARTVEKILSRAKDGTAYVGTSCGLEYLPRDRAFDKLKLLAGVKKSLAG